MVRCRYTVEPERATLNSMPVLTRPRRDMAAAMRRRWVSGPYRSNWPGVLSLIQRAARRPRRSSGFLGRLIAWFLCHTGHDDCSVSELRLLACATLLDAAQTVGKDPHQAVRVDRVGGARTARRPGDGAGPRGWACLAWGSMRHDPGSDRLSTLHAT